MQQGELEEIDKIEEFLRETCNSLLHDVRHAVLYEYSTPDWPTPIPALLYCFSVLEMLGAFRSGSRDHPAENAGSYIKEFMGYDEVQLELLKAIFEYKLCFPTQSQFLFHRHGIDYYWEWIDNDRQRHLTLRSHLGSGPMARWFTLSILSFAEDIEASVFQKDKYVNQLFMNPNLKFNAKKIFRQFLNYTSHS